MISIVITTYNSGNFIKECLESIFSQDFKNYEIIIVDNNSKDNTKEILRDYHGIALIENETNSGFSKAYNQGINKAKGSYILCLNHDITLTKGFLAQIRQAITLNDKIGAIQPKVLNISGDKIDTAGIHLSFLRRFYDIGAGKQNQDKFNRCRYIFGACAAAALYRKQALDSIKQNEQYFDQDFFCLVEDVDLSWRLKKKKWRTLYFPAAACLHNRGISQKKDRFSQYLNMKNRYLMLLKNESFSGLFNLFIAFFVYDLWRNLFMLLTNTKYCVKAYYEIAKLSSKIIKNKIISN
ncbi:MAG: glycosyltransferase family 2 protein [Candidatus Omnitrophota bacterium]